MLSGNGVVIRCSELIYVHSPSVFSETRDATGNAHKHNSYGNSVSTSTSTSTSTSNSMATETVMAAVSVVLIQPDSIFQPPADGFCFAFSVKAF
ncbi:hypothetical protein ANANG_G00010050 [Anguilla anguilla]|uniref:Uncharacterized protein n=1 Tax=Anguilla anguilla TaxID=7936 RepID=A0A9D3MWM1_ANGAN|nr:hypothetical protein ANANG_G00010050 [Anguilla anguilla]